MIPARTEAAVAGHHHPLLSVVSLAPSGGGVGVVARLLWQVFHEQWAADARLLTLIQGDRAQPTFADKARYAVALAALQASGRADWVMYAHLGLAKPLLGMPRSMRRPYAVFLHGIEAWCPLPDPQLELLASARIRIANSRYTAARVMEAHPQIGSVQVCPLALPRAQAPTEAASPARRPAPFGPHAVVVVGRMSAAERYKGHDELLDAWPAVVARVPDARLIFAGSGDDVERLKDRAARSTVSATIEFAGFVSEAELGRLYDSAALFALPSRAEGFGLVYLEAMAHRLACIGSVRDAAQDVIVHNETGLLVDQDREGELSTALIALLLDDERRERMGILGQRRLQSEFTPERFTARLVALLAPDVMSGSAAA